MSAAPLSGAERLFGREYLAAQFGTASSGRASATSARTHGYNQRAFGYNQYVVDSGAGVWQNDEITPEERAWIAQDLEETRRRASLTSSADPMASFTQPAQTISADEHFLATRHMHQYRPRPASHQAAAVDYGKQWIRVPPAERLAVKEDLNQRWVDAEIRAMANHNLEDHEAAIVKQRDLPFAENMPQFHSYLLYRGNGIYTRMIPADLLPPLVGIPATQSDRIGSWVLMPPTAQGPNGSWLCHTPVEVVVSHRPNLFVWCFDRC